MHRTTTTSWYDKTCVPRRWPFPTTTASSAAAAAADDSGNDSGTAAAAASASASSLPEDLTGLTVYQRVFYQFTYGATAGSSSSSVVDVPDSVVIEERVRYQADPARGTGYVKPVGPRTIILRDGNVADGEIGDDFFTLHVVHDNSNSNDQHHTGKAGSDPVMDAAIAAAIYLASNPALCCGNVLQLGCDTGLAGLLGVIGAGRVSHRNDNKQQDKDKQDDQQQQQILTVPTGLDAAGLLPADLDCLTLSDSDSDKLNAVFHNVKESAIPASKVELKQLDWRSSRIPAAARQQSAAAGAGSSSSQEYYTVLASDLVSSFPEAKELARTVSNVLEPSAWYLSAVSTGKTEQERTRPAPKFIHLAPDGRDDVSYLRKFLESGYRMRTEQTAYVNMEKLYFQFQFLPAAAAEQELDDLPLELRDCRQSRYHCLTAQHHADYPGAGSGEWFFPMENGAFDGGPGGPGAGTSAESYMEPPFGSGGGGGGGNSGGGGSRGGTVGGGGGSMNPFV